MSDSSRSDVGHSPLGKPAAYVDRYDPGLLCPITRSIQRMELGLHGAQVPFLGADIWNGYELSWLSLRGRPQVATFECIVPAETPNIIESKSFKLYVNSFSGTRFADAETVQRMMQRDLSLACGAAVRLRVLPLNPDAPRRPLGFQAMTGDGGPAPISLDRLDIECLDYQPAPRLLKVASELAPHEEVLVSDLLKSNCPVTGQPDWGSIRVHYYGQPIDHAGLLAYLISFRDHNEFHEHCVERVFVDLLARCAPTRLTVYARYTRRGGLDINPYRASHSGMLPPNVRTERQ